MKQPLMLSQAGRESETVSFGYYESTQQGVQESAWR
jgi:hypothetical protein